MLNVGIQISTVMAGPHCTRSSRRPTPDTGRFRSRSALSRRTPTGPSLARRRHAGPDSSHLERDDRLADPQREGPGTPLNGEIGAELPVLIRAPAIRDVIR